MAALDGDADYVDLEFAHGFDDAVRSRRGRNIILSLHDFAGCPADLEARVDAMAALNPDVLKVAITVSRLAECGRLADLASAARGPAHGPRRDGGGGPRDAPLSGPVRLLLDVRRRRRGARPDRPRAPDREFRFRRVGPATALYGVAGRPVSHSLSPAMHNAAFESLGVDAAYVPLAAADLDDLFDGIRVLGAAGVSVTAPFKVRRDDARGGARPDATLTGAVNTLVREAGSWRGCNTDVEGFRAGCAGVDLRGRRVAVLGTGGAARAVALAARRAGAAVTCYGRDRARADALAAALGVGAALRPVPAGSWDVLVNATPIGTHPDAGAVGVSGVDLRRQRGLRPGLQPGAHPVPARGVGARMPDHRRTRDAGGAGGLGKSNSGRACGRIPGPCATRRNWKLSRQAERA